MIARKVEQSILQELLDSPTSEFLAVTGRRRVGKTYLIDSYYGKRFCFSMTGIQDQGAHEQLVNFAVRLAEVDGTGEPNVPQSWQWAFVRLRNFLETLSSDSKQVIFLDELPWIAASDKGFVQMLAHFWNDYLSKRHHFILVICGSATAWITQKILNDPGGMHNRVTRQIHVNAFGLRDTREYLRSKRINLSDTDLARTYMALGGIPYYLNGVKRGDSFVTAIERLCFSPTGMLRREYGNLFAALFKNADTHESIVQKLANYPQGLSRTAIVNQTGLKSQSAVSIALQELLASDFLAFDLAHGNKKRGARYRLKDEFSLFHHRFMEVPGTTQAGYWQSISQSPTFRTWAGYAFELLCRKEIGAIKRKLGISGMAIWAGPLDLAPTEDERGVQIDLLLDRPDGTVNLCEMKFYTEPFQLTKDIALELLRKRKRVREYFKGRKQVLITLITNHPATPNKWTREVVDSFVNLDDILML